MTTLPSRGYSDPAIYALERERIFFRTWQWVAHVDELARPGDYVTTEVLGEPLVIVRDDGPLRAFFNVCRHRAGPIAEGRGNRKVFQCRYHGWTYGLDGRLKRAPEMEDTPGFDAESVCLPSVRVATWGDLVLVKLEDGGPSIEETFAGIDERLATGMRLVERREYLVVANWKVYVDNFLEGYHIPLVHPALYELVDYDRYRVETAAYSSRQVTPLRRGEDDEAQYFWVFPNLMLNFYPGSLQMNLVVPRGPEETLTLFEWYNTSGTLTEELKASIAFSDRVQREDMDIVAAVQKGLLSRSYDTGPLSARRENGVAHFQALVREYLS